MGLDTSSIASFHLKSTTLTLTYIDPTPLQLSNILAQRSIVLDNQAGQLLSDGNLKLLKLENFY